jgi:hypothetical protein
MVEVTYHCPYCGAVTGVERDGYLADDCVTREPLDGWEYAAATDDVETIEAADGIEFVCLGTGGDAADQEGAEATGAGPDAGGADDPNPGKDGCGRTFYLSFLKHDEGSPVEHRTPNIDPPRFDFQR